MTDTPTRLVTIDFFIKQMMGWKTLSSYYSHLDDEGWPQRVYPTGKPMLVLSECQAYIDGLLANRAKPGMKHKRAKAGEGARADQPPKRHRGRPAKTLRPEGANHSADNGQT